MPCRCFREIVDPTDGLTYEICWILFWLQLELATSWIHPLMSAALLPVISQIRLPVWSACPPIIFYDNGKSPICRWFSYIIPIKFVFFHFFHCHVKLPEDILPLNLSACWFSHSFSWPVSLQDLHVLNLAKVPCSCCQSRYRTFPCLVASTSISAWFHHHLLLESRNRFALGPDHYIVDPELGDTYAPKSSYPEKASQKCKFQMEWLCCMFWHAM